MSSFASLTTCSATPLRRACALGRLLGSTPPEDARGDFRSSSHFASNGAILAADTGKGIMTTQSSDSRTTALPSLRLQKVERSRPAARSLIGPSLADHNRSRWNLRDLRIFSEGIAHACLTGTVSSGILHHLAILHQSLQPPRSASPSERAPWQAPATAQGTSFGSSGD